MDVLNHLFGALGRILLSISCVLTIEELTLGGLARILLSKRYDSGSRNGGRAAAASASGKKVGSR
jgi:hypothetical protein